MLEQSNINYQKQMVKATRRQDHCKRNQSY